MSFHDVALPGALQYSSAAGSGFSTIVQETSSGHEVRIQRQAQGRRRFRLRKNLITTVEAASLQSFALERRGAFHSFKLQDFSDYSTASDGAAAPTIIDQVIGVGDGTTTGPYQLLKSYGSVNPYPRVLTLPVNGTVLVAIDEVQTTAFTVNGQGQVTLDSPPALGVIITAGCQFYVPVRFASSFDVWAALQADAFNVWSVPELDCIEVLNEVENPERNKPNGGRDWGTIAASFRVALNDGNVQHCNPSAAISMLLPVPTDIPGGNDIFTVSVAPGATGSLQVRDDAGAAIGSAMVAGEVKRLGLAVDASGNSTWVLG